MYFVDVSMFSPDSDMLKSLPKLSRQELEVACEDFSNIIGSSPQTVVYKGTMKDGPEVSVISLCAFEGHWTSHHELFYQNKVSYGHYGMQPLPFLEIKRDDFSGY